METGTLIKDLTLILVCAGVVTFLFRLLKLPLLLGYLLSGLLLGPNFFTKSPIQDLQAIKELSEFGVIFLMFYIGLEFDIKKLKRIMGPAFLAVFLQTVVMLLVGTFTASMLGWSNINGLFLGCLLAISSTMITLPILREQNELKANFAQVAIGILVLEDILAIIVLVVLTGVGINGFFEWGAVWRVVFLVGIFVVTVYVIGKLAAPRVLTLLKKFDSPEVLTIVTVGVVLGIGELANHYNFSIALGAFLAGSIISQQPLAKEIEHAIEPMRNLFTGVFFVTIGMLIDPKMLLENWQAIVLLTLCVVVGKTITVWIGLFVTGEKTRTAFRAALYKAQIGEFSFVIAGLGIQYSVTEPALMTLAVGVSLGTILIIPFAAKQSIPLYDFFCRRTPSGLKQAGTLYNSFIALAKERISSNAFLKLISKPVFYILIYFLLLNGVIIIAFLSSRYLDSNPDIFAYMNWVQYSLWITAALILLPFLIAIIRNLDVILMLILQSAFNVNKRQNFTNGKFINILSSIILCIIMIISGSIYLSFAASYLPSGRSLFALVGFVILTGVFFWRHIVRINSRLENMLIESFHSTTVSSDADRRKEKLKQISEKYPWPVNLQDIIVPERALVSGKSIMQLNLRQETGMTIVGINRGDFTLYDPAPDMPIFPGDHLILLGTEAQREKAAAILKEITPDNLSGHNHRFEIEKILVSANSSLEGSTLADTNLRRQYGINVVGIQRGEEQITAPLPEEMIKANDVLMVVGNPDSITNFRNQLDKEVN